VNHRGTVAPSTNCMKWLLRLCGQVLCVFAQWVTVMKHTWKSPKEIWREKCGPQQASVTAGKKDGDWRKMEELDGDKCYPGNNKRLSQVRVRALVI